MDALIARQAIFDRQRNMHGYELLYRSNTSSNAFDGTEADDATMQVLSNMLLSIGQESLLSGKKAFVNFDHRLLAAGMHKSLPRESIVVEILETVEPTPDLIALCQGIARDGYTLALDDFTDDIPFEPLTRIAGVIKVDMRLTSRAEQERLLRRYKPRGVLMLAEKVETYAEFEWARRAGYDLFQGYFFARPVMVRRQQIPAGLTACLQLLRELRPTDLDFGRIERLIRDDVSLSYKLLRYANSAAFHQCAKIESIPAALLRIGESNVRRWVSLATLPKLAANKPSELVTLSLVRAHFCERLATLAGMKNADQAYLMGMFSLLDALLDQPLDEALQSVDLGEAITQALLGIDGSGTALGGLYKLTLSYEMADWDEVRAISERYGISSSAVGSAYIDSTVNVARLQSTA